MADGLTSAIGNYLWFELSARVTFHPIEPGNHPTGESQEASRVGVSPMIFSNARILRFFPLSIGFPQILLNLRSHSKLIHLSY